MSQKFSQMEMDYISQAQQMPSHPLSSMDYYRHAQQNLELSNTAVHHATVQAASLHSAAQAALTSAGSVLNTPQQPYVTTNEGKCVSVWETENGH